MVKKMDGSALDTFGMVIANFQVEDKIDRLRFFWETFLGTDTKFKLLLRMLFWKIKNADMLFDKKTLM